MGGFLLLLPGISRAGGCNPIHHAPIWIKSNADFTAANGVTSGSGAANNPYVISNWQFKDLSPGFGLKIGGSQSTISVYFTITCIQSNFATVPKAGAVLVWVSGVHTGFTIDSVAGNSGETLATTGIRVDSSSHGLLSNEDPNKLGKNGVDIIGSDHMTIITSKLKALGDGLFLSNSHDLTVGQACALSSGNGCDEFTYDDGRGIEIQNSFNILIQYTITAADDTGGILVSGTSTSNVVLTNGDSSGNGPICPASVGAPTGLFTDTVAGFAIVNGAHGVTMTGYNVHGNTHFDLMNGGDGLYINPCTGLTESVGFVTPSGGAALAISSNCYGSEFGFIPVPTVSCPTS